MLTRCFLFLHLDDFAASAEQYAQPDLRGKPVVVGCSPFPKGKVLSASVEARVFGIVPQMSIETAYQLCPGARFLSLDEPKYKSVFGAIALLCADFTDRIEPASLGNLFLDVTGCPVTKSVPVGKGAWGFAVAEVARLIGERIAAEYGMTVSVGVAAAKGVARIVSHCRRPGGITVAPPARERDSLARLPLRYMELESETEALLRDFGLSAIGDLAALSLPPFLRKFGPSFARVHQLANGRDEAMVAPFEFPPEVGAEEVFDFAQRAADLGDCLAVLSERVAAKLAADGIVGRVLLLRLQLADRSRTLSLVLKEHSDKKALLLRAALKLLSAMPAEETVGQVSLALTDLVLLQPDQLTLLPNRQAKGKAIRESVQSLQQRFGPRCLLRVVPVPSSLPERSFHYTEVDEDEQTLLPTRAGSAKSGIAQRPLLAGKASAR